MLDFQRYQLEFTAHIRDPQVHKKPAGVNALRMAVYRTAVFNNIFESISVCFPVCQATIDKRVWRKLIKEFVKNYQATSPIFREIPQQFLQFLNTTKNLPLDVLPGYLKQLAHYEWAELAIGAQQIETIAPGSINANDAIDLLNEKPILAPASMLLDYDYAVHKISRRNKPKTIEKTHLLVFRNTENIVKFIELNPMTFQLLNLIQKSEVSGKQVLTDLAKAINHPNTDMVIQFGKEILTDLANQQAIIGSAKLK